MEPMLIGFIDGGNMLKHQSKQVGNNQQRNPSINEFLVIALNVRIKQPSV